MSLILTPISANNFIINLPGQLQNRSHGVIHIELTQHQTIRPHHSTQLNLPACTGRPPNRTHRADSAKTEDSADSAETTAEITADTEDISEEMTTMATADIAADTEEDRDIAALCITITSQRKN